MSNFVMEPIPKDWKKNKDFRFLVAIKDPVWYSKNPLGRERVGKNFIKGSVCWTDYRKTDCVLIEGHSVNYDPNCFKEISLKDIEIIDKDGYSWANDGNKIEILTGVKDEETEFLRVFLKDCKISYKGSLDTKENYPVTPEEAFESKYRFKTEEEFRRDGLWSNGFPIGWNSSGRMNHYIGKPIASAYNIMCDNKEYIKIYDVSKAVIWSFRPEDYVLNDSKKDPETTSKIVAEFDPAMDNTSDNVTSNPGIDMGVINIYFEDSLKTSKKESKNKTESYTFTKSKNIVI